MNPANGVRQARQRAARLGLSMRKCGALVELLDDDRVVFRGALVAVEAYLAARAAPRRSGPPSAELPAAWRPLVDAFVQEQRAANRSVGTIATRVGHLTQFALAHRHSDPLTVERATLAEWIAQPGWSPSYRRSMRATMRVFFTTLHRLGVRHDDPSLTLPTVAAPRSQPRPCPDDVVRSAYAAATDPRVRLALRIAVETGLRRAEIAALMVADVEGPPGGYRLRVRGKGGHVRLVPVADELADVLAGLGTRYVFPAATGGHLTPRWLGRLVTDALGGAPWTTHTLRHRFATLAYQASTDLRAVQELLGHSSPVTTAAYTAVGDDSMRRAAAAARHLSSVNSSTRRTPGG